MDGGGKDNGPDGGVGGVVEGGLLSGCYYLVNAGCTSWEWVVMVEIERFELHFETANKK